MANQTLRLLQITAELAVQISNARKLLAEEEFFKDLDSWEIGFIHRNCRVENDRLYTSKGILLSSDSCMDENIPYFVNQCNGSLGDDYYGTMYINVDNNNTFVEISYSC